MITKHKKHTWKKCGMKWRQVLVIMFTGLSYDAICRLIVWNAKPSIFILCSYNTEKPNLNIWFFFLMFDLWALSRYLLTSAEKQRWFPFKVLTDQKGNQTRGSGCQQAAWAHGGQPLLPPLYCAGPSCSSLCLLLASWVSAPLFLLLQSHAVMPLLLLLLPHHPSACLQTQLALLETSWSKTYLAEISGRSIWRACLIPVHPSPHLRHPASPPGSYALHGSSPQYSGHENKTLRKHSFNRGQKRGCEQGSHRNGKSIEKTIDHFNHRHLVHC